MIRTICDSNITFLKKLEFLLKLLLRMISVSWHYLQWCNISFDSDVTSLFFSASSRYSAVPLFKNSIVSCTTFFWFFTFVISCSLIFQFPHFSKSTVSLLLFSNTNLHLQLASLRHFFNAWRTMYSWITVFSDVKWL